MKLRTKLLASTLALGSSLGGVAVAFSGPANASTPIQINCATMPALCQIAVPTLPPSTLGPPPTVKVPPTVSIPPGVTIPPHITIPPINPCALSPKGCKPPATVPDPGGPYGTDDCTGGPTGCDPAADVPVKARPTFTG